MKKTTYNDIKKLCDSIGYEINIDSTSLYKLQMYLRDRFKIDVEVNRNTWSTDRRYYGRFNVKVLQDMKEKYIEKGFENYHGALKDGIKIGLMIVQTIKNSSNTTISKTLNT